MRFNRVLVANRGEVAVRVIRALHELDIEAVAVYSMIDRDSLHVRLADRAVCIGPAAAARELPSHPVVIAAANTTGCQAVHPGWGFLAENAAFAEACAENDLVFVGPSSEVLALMGDKASAREEMRAAGVPVVPGTPPLEADEHADAAEELGFPVLLKAAAGGGGKGMRLVETPEQLEGAVGDGDGGGRSRVRRRPPLPREGDRPRAPCRDPGARRFARRRPHARGARVLDPAPLSEADRRVALSGADAGRAGAHGVDRRAGSSSDRLHERRHLRVPPRSRRLVLLHRAERPAPGRASGQRSRDRHRPRP